MKKKMVATNVRKIENSIVKAIKELDNASKMYECMNFADKESAQNMQKIKRYRDGLLNVWGHFADITKQMESKKQ